MQRLRFADLKVPLHLAHTHVTRLVGSHESQAHTHDFYEIVLVLEGSGIHHLNGRRDDLAVGQLIAIQPKDVHWFSTMEGQSLAFVNVAVSTVWWEAFHALLGLPNWTESSRSTTFSPSETARLGVELKTTYAAADSMELVKVWKKVHVALSASARPASAVPPDWLEALRQDIISMTGALQEPISFWQQRSGCSPEHLSRSCRRFYGVTLRELINIARIERAKSLLRTTDDKVITIAFKCGFENMANFHRTFARLTGVTPSQWRKMGTVTVPLRTPQVLSLK